MLSYHCLQSLIPWHCSASINFLFIPFSDFFDSSASRALDSIHSCTLQIMFDVVRNHAVCFCTNLREHSPGASHLFLIRSDPILHRNPGRHHPVSNYRTNPTDQELYHKLQLTESGHIPYKQFASLSRIGCRSSSTLTLLLEEVLEMIFLNADAILVSSISKSGQGSP